ncbi:MAG: AAA family ATPase [Deltaproteobacteria bacterium]|nr:AAA family ATPase [Deltaproteobacteria bacterium]
MKVHQIRLCPFAGLANTTVKFGPALTVVSGPNEAGKSTILHALESVLFVRTDLTPARAQQFAEPFMPAGGGDTVLVEVEFSHEAKHYKLCRQWGASPSARLELPDGSVVSGEDQITERLADLLVATPGTFRSVLMARQAGLAHTLERLEEGEGGQTVRDLSNLLTEAVQETDGVAVDDFIGELDSQLKKYFSRWDKKHGAPEGGRGVENRWRREPGDVLCAWYEKEEVKRDRDNAIAIEKQIDELNGRIAGAARLHAELEQYLAANRDAVDSVAARRALDAQETALSLQKAKYAQANTDWPVLVRDLEQLDAQKAQLVALVDELKAEHEAATVFEGKKGLVAQLARATVRKQELIAAEGKLRATPALTSEQLKQIAATASQVRELQTRLSAGRLKARLTAKEALATELQIGVEKPVEKKIATGTTIDIEAAGAFKLDSSKWSLEVQSGSVDFESIAAELASTSSRLANLLQGGQASDEEDARRRSAAYEEACRAVATAKKILDDELAGQTFEELQAKAGGNAAPATTRPLADVRADLVKAQGDLDVNSKEAMAKRGRLTELEKTYGDKDKLFDKVVETVAAHKDLDKERAQLAPLPAGIGDLDAYVDEYRKKEKASKSCGDELKRLEIEKAGIVVPDDSAEELDVRYRELQEVFESVLRRANAIERIRTVADEVQKESGAADRSTELKASLEHYISRLTEERYRRIEMSDTLPSGFVRNDGAILGASLLSTGTRDVLGLALRLTMGSYFLDDDDGFLVMDDPLVDLDPARRAAASEVLNEYAKEHQVIVFTCQPTHAEVLGGTTVELE